MITQCDMYDLPHETKLRVFNHEACISIKPMTTPTFIEKVNLYIDQFECGCFSGYMTACEAIIPFVESLDFDDEETS